jgi:glycogen(starch) synthase
MSLHVLLVTDAFPPACGGSGWSTYELARGLRSLGHEVTLVRPRPRAGSVKHGRLRAAEAYDRFVVHEYETWAPRLPFVRNYFKNERLARSLGVALQRLIAERRIDIVHAQHVLSTPGAVEAARAGGVPVIGTVRDYWPVCYWSDLIYDYSSPTLCPSCSAGMMTRCIRPRAGALWPAALPMIPYMQANLQWKRRSLAAADAIIAVSSTIARDLRARAPELAGRRIEVIPNPVDAEAIRTTAGSAPPAIPRPYAIFVGKLAPNKGVGTLIGAVQAAKLRWPLVIVGDGPERAEMERAARRSSLDVRFTGWLDRNDALTYLAHADLLLFPSYGPESLSRVLLEASTLGVAAAAMDTGGTRDILTDEETALLSRNATEFSTDIGRLAGDDALRRRLGDAARESVNRKFAAPVVVGAIERLYHDVRARAGIRRSA